MRRIPLCMCFAGIPILNMRSDDLTIPKLVVQIGKLHLAVRIGVLKLKFVNGIELPITWTA